MPESFEEEKKANDDPSPKNCEQQDQQEVSEFSENSYDEHELSEN